MKYPDRREFLKILSTGVILTAAGGIDFCSGQRKKLPNIVYILADDMGYGDVSCLNSDSKIPTPYMDSLAEDGVIFTDVHSGSAVCTPTRYGILTGRYCWRSRLKSGVLWGYSLTLIEKERLTAASLLKQYGYFTGCIGKWHLGLDWATADEYRYSDRSDETGEHIDYSKPVKRSPLDAGFDYFFGIPASLDMVPYVYVENDRAVKPPVETINGREGYEFYRGGPSAPGFKHEDVLFTLTEKAVNFIDRCAAADKNKPFFLYFPLTAPHTPILPGKEFNGTSKAGVYGDFVHQCDWTIGQVMQTLEKHGLSDNTLFIVTSDNGCSPAAGFEDLAEKGHFPSYHFRGYKADIYEGGHRIPFIARWPGNIPAGSECDDTICLTDLMATVAEILDIKLPDDAGEDSVSILPDLLGTAKAPVREATVHHSINGSFSIRQGKWKLELCPGSGGWSYPKPAKARALKLPEVQLYNLSEDIGEKKNLCNEYPEVVERLTELLEQYVKNGRSTPGKPQKNDSEVNIRKS